MQLRSDWPMDSYCAFQGKVAVTTAVSINSECLSCSLSLFNAAALSFGSSLFQLPGSLYSHHQSSIVSMGATQLQSTTEHMGSRDTEDSYSHSLLAQDTPLSETHSQDFCIGVCTVLMVVCSCISVLALLLLYLLSRQRLCMQTLAKAMVVKVHCCGRSLKILHV